MEISSVTLRVLVRDAAEDRAYHGSVEGVSETADRAELLLRDVTVYTNSTSEKLYEADRVYLARDPRNVVIEHFERDDTPGERT